MGRNQEEIAASIRAELPVIFGGAGTVDDAEYSRKQDAMTEYAMSVTGPFMAPETIRYQSILLYVSLTFISLSLFEVGELQIGDALISIDRQYFHFYAGFIVVVAAIFLVKAFVDFQRSRFTREKNTHTVLELRDLMSIGFLRGSLQRYFWLEIFDKIGAPYKNYEDSLARALDQESSFKHVQMNVMNLDLQKLREIPDLATEIDHHQKFLNELEAELSRDCDQFTVKAEEALSIPKPSLEEFFSDDRWEKINAAFDEHLRPWFEARGKLASEQLDHMMDELSGSLDQRRLDAMAMTLKRIFAIRRTYVALEIVAPALFALLVVLYVAFL